MKYICIALSSFLLSACLSCGPIRDLRDFTDADLFPPVIENILPIDQNTVRLEFNEQVELTDGPSITPALGGVEVSYGETCIILKFASGQQAGTRYVIDAGVADSTGNSMSFLMPFYGFNPYLPGLLINEFTTQGSTTHPDLVELLITEKGNIAGLWIVEGTTDYPEQSLVFPPCEVDAGDYILIHFKPQGIPAETDEPGDDLAVSGGYDSSPEARDFWLEGGSGLSGNNGVIAVYSAPGGSILDAVLYSNRTSASDDKYEGFGSQKMLDKAVQLVEEGGWTAGGDEGNPIPEDAIDPEDSTATRSMCRNSVAQDTESKEDWHIVPNGSSTFGGLNTDDIYE